MATSCLGADPGARQLRQDVCNILRTGEEIEDYANDTPFPSALLFGWKGAEPIHVVVALDSITQQG